MFEGFLLKILVYPLSLVYGLITSVRNFLYDSKVFKSKSYDIPVISVGNLAVGGTGKTPHVEYILNLLKDEENVAMLSRGYKRKTKGYKLANENDTSHTIGDEPYQIKSKFPDVVVAVDESRQRGIEQLIANENIKTVVLDDAFQHRKVTPGLNILLTDFNRPFTKDHFLPVGRLREHAHEYRRAHIIIITKCPNDIKPIQKRILAKEINPYPFQSVFFTALKYGALSNVFDSSVKLSISEIKEKGVLAISGIANNKHFQSKLNEISSDVQFLQYPDHYNYTEKDIKKIETAYRAIKNNNKIIITTEKDAVKLKHLQNWDDDIKKNVFLLPIKISFLNDAKQENEFKQQILKYVKTNRKHSYLYKGKNNH